MCNECGNCAVFCPWSGRPYKDKLTLFWSAEDMDASENRGFLPVEGVFDVDDAAVRPARGRAPHHPCRPRRLRLPAGQVIPRDPRAEALLARGSRQATRGETWTTRPGASGSPTRAASAAASASARAPRAPCTLEDKQARIDYALCIACGMCATKCRKGVIHDTLGIYAPAQ